MPVALENILPALDDLDPDQPAQALCRLAVEANARRTDAEILATPEAQARFGRTHLILGGAVYGIESGCVRFFGP